VLAGHLKTVAMSQTKEKLDRADEVARSRETSSDPDLLRLAISKDALERLAAIRLMQTRAEQAESILPYLAAARRLIHDPDNTCRWQALILVSSGIEREPELVWEVIEAEGGVRDDDMRTGVATVLLEDLLEQHFEAYFPKVRARVLSGDELFTDTVSQCWLSEPSHKKRIASLVRNARRGSAKNEAS
jgi:DNA-binding TFAR19-related protein (PDSD5 family)